MADTSEDMSSFHSRNDSVSVGDKTDKESVSSGGASSQSTGADDVFFGKFCRHVPRILRHQIISKLVNQYVYKVKHGDEIDTGVNRTASKQGDPGVDFKANTSIYRFHGALLFVDISGFTVLSQKLKVDELKNQINAYFQKIVDIINKYDGEIIKFAGDALFIIWQTKVSDTNDPHFLVAAKEAADKAVTCGVEINFECGNYAINLKPSMGDSIKVKALLETIEKPRDVFNHQQNRAVPAPAPVPAPAHSGSPGKSPRSGAAAGASKKHKKKASLVTYLNVHAGVSIGVMAGMDVGAQDRFEYLLLGKPMSDVAIAEGDAEKGEIVVSPAVHDLLHNYTSLRASAASSPRPAPAETSSAPAAGNAVADTATAPVPATDHGGDRSLHKHVHTLSCGCERTSSGFYKIRNTLDEMLCVVDFGAAPANPDPADASTAPEDLEANEDVQYEFDVYAQVVEELMLGYKVVSPQLLEKFSGVIQKLALVAQSDLAADNANGTSTHADAKSSSAAIEYTEKEIMSEHFFSWAQHCLLDDIARHVHEVVRRGFSFYHENRAAPFEKFLDSPQCIDTFRRELERTQGHSAHHHHHRGSGQHRNISALTNQSASSTGSAHSSVSSANGSVSAANARSSASSSAQSAGARGNGDSFVTKMRQLTGASTLRERKQNKHQKVLSKDGALVSELRNVMVLFISVKTGDASVHLDPKHALGAMGTDDAPAVPLVQTCKVESFHFLARTVDEIEADKRLINQFQSCMEVMSEVFHAKGGQLRQFIVDDKGTVCIGTFGLRGSVNYDNAAAAIDAADLIVARIQALGFNASVGVTSGAAYCGLVGSRTRHEYAVMGPSTNLSARLMGRAGPGEILCDSAIRQRDRAHAYTSLGAIKAKGYTNLVPIFKPHFGADDDPSATTSLAVENPSMKNGLAETKQVVLKEVYGRKEDALTLFTFYFTSMVKSGMETLADAFWIPAVTESADSMHDRAYELPCFDFSGKSSHSSKKRAVPSLHSPPRLVRFDISQRTKKAVVISPNGMGKTALLNLFQLKLNSLVAKDSSYYNVAVFRHQVGYINSSTVFSAWFCMTRQTLFSIAIAIAEDTSDPAAVQRLDAMKENNFTPMITFLAQYLPPQLQSFTALLNLVGINLPVPAQDTTVVSDLSSLEELGALSDGDGPAPESGKTDPVSALDPSEQLQKCAELIVAIVQLHVNITRRLSVYIMDDLQHHDQLSQTLGGLLAHTTTGVCLLCTFRTSQSYSNLRASVMHANANDAEESTLSAGASPLLTSAPMMSYERAMRELPLSSQFLRLELKPITAGAGKKLLAKIFADHGIVHIEDGVLEKLHGMSAGSPLYATELAKSICDRYVHRENCAEDMHGETACSLQLGAIIEHLSTDRIEEVVHFRFDKLTEQCQLVLKMAAVASVNGSHFTLSMLTSILDSSERSESSKLQQVIHDTKALLGYLSDPDEAEAQLAQGTRGGGALANTMDLVQALNDLLESEEFIEFRGDLPTPSAPGEVGAVSSYQALQLLVTAPTPTTPKPDLNQLLSEDAGMRARAGSRAPGVLHQLRFYWKVDMELRAIYDLMLDEQKESLHDRVASFLEQEQQRSAHTSASEWFEQGYHWERSTSWSSAMNCYFHAGMALKEVGDSAGCKTHLTAAFRMLDKMRHDAGVQFLDGHRVTPASSSSTAPETFHMAVCARPTAAPASFSSDMDIKQMAVQGMEYILCGRNAGLRAEDIYKMFEQSSALLHVGMSVVVRLAQSLIGTGAAELSYRLFEDCMDMVHTIKNVPEPLLDVDGGEFTIRKKDLCFPILSGMFLLLLNDMVQDPHRHGRMVAVISLAMQLARTSPEYELHLVFAYVNKIWLLNHFLAMEPSVVEHIFTYSDLLQKLYNREKHSKDIIYYYNSDRVASALSVPVKLLCMLGRYADALRHLDSVKSALVKQKHFYSLSLGTAGMFTVLLVYFPGAQAQLMFDNLLRAQQKNGGDFQAPAQVFAECLAQQNRLAQYRASGDDSVFDGDSAFVENLLQTGEMLQNTTENFTLNLLRMYSSALEYAAAKICAYKAARYALLYQQDPERGHLAKALSYLRLGLLHLIFTPAQEVKNQNYTFANLHEKVLRAQLLIKYLQLTTAGTAVATNAGNTLADPTAGISRTELWEQARLNLSYCCEVGSKHGLHGILLQAGALMKELSAVASAVSVSAESGTGEGSADAVVAVEDAVVQALAEEGAQLYDASLAYIQEHNGDTADVVAAMIAPL